MKYIYNEKKIYHTKNILIQYKSSAVTKSLNLRAHFAICYGLSLAATPSEEAFGISVKYLSA